MQSNTGTVNIEEWKRLEGKRIEKIEKVEMKCYVIHMLGSCYGIAYQVVIALAMLREKQTGQ